MTAGSSLLPLLAPLKRGKLFLPAFLVPSCNQPRRNASILSSLSDRPGAYNRRIRVGRGPASGKGKTSGRGHKGQKQKGKVPKNFTGGQTPEDVVHGHYGFKNVHAIDLTPVNLDRIQDWIDQGRIDPTKPITLKELCATRAIHGIKDGVKLLSRGASLLTSPINIVVSRASSSAISAVEALGGTVTTRFYTKFAIRRIKQGKTDPYVSMKWDPSALPLPVGMGSDPVKKVRGNGFQYRLPDPTSRKELEYYRDPAKRGYLSHTLKEGEFPSLFFKRPVNDPLKLEKARAARKALSENRLW